MTKKPQTRKPNISSETLERARRELAEGAQIAPAPTPKASNQTSVKSSTSRSKEDNLIIRSSSKKRTMSQDELSKEYGYVLRDLRSMGILAFALFVSMIVVSLILNQLV